MERLPSPLPEPESPALERYQIYSRAEIVAIARELLARRALLSLHFGGDRSVVTAVLAVNPDFEELVIDAPKSGRDTDAIVRSPALIAVAFLDHVKIQFRSMRAEATSFAGAPAIRVRLPDSILRLQRRDFFRVPAPQARPLRLYVPPQSAGGTAAEYRVLDISAGGLCIAIEGTQSAFEPGVTLADCRLDLPGLGTVVAAVQVQHVSRSRSAGGALHTRCGLQFLRLAPGMGTLVQRYINQVQRERL